MGLYSSSPLEKLTEKLGSDKSAPTGDRKEKKKEIEKI